MLSATDCVMNQVQEFNYHAKDSAEGDFQLDAVNVICSTTGCIGNIGSSYCVYGVVALGKPMHCNASKPKLSKFQCLFLGFRLSWLTNLADNACVPYYRSRLH